MIRAARTLPRTDPRRRGAALILFAMLVFVVMAVAGLVIDLGVASLTQAQMQTAVDTAALEGCRLRNYEEYPGVSHSAKRGRASHLVRQVFDDDLRPTRGGYAQPNGQPAPPDDADSVGFAAGPGQRVSGGVGTLAASATIGTVDAAQQANLDDPWLQSNLPNAQNGDQVAGRFEPDNPHVEHGDYSRTDFDVATTVLDKYQALSFLVRMRRSGSANPLDAQSGVSTNLPRLPFLFALGSTMRKADGGSWDPRRDGLTVRATAIASARPALRVGPPPRQNSNPDSPGVPDQSGAGWLIGKPMLGTYPFALNQEAWQSFFVSEPNTWHDAKVLHFTASDGSGALRLGGQQVGVFASGVQSVGDRLQIVPAPPQGERPLTADQLSWGGYIPIYAESPVFGPGVWRVIGYGFASVTWSLSSPSVLNVRPGVSDTSYSAFNVWIAQDNASAHLDGSIGSLSAEELREVLRLNERLVYGDTTLNPGGQPTYDYTRIRRGSVLAPVLTR